MKRSVIAYHGTDTTDKVISILKNGFNIGTWFAFKVEDALRYGGEHVLAVSFNYSKFRNMNKNKNDSWQFFTTVKIPNYSARIISYEWAYKNELLTMPIILKDPKDGNNEST